jgi:predicted MFS family arabinose efflux permease
MAVFTVTTQTAQVVGFAAGGVIVAAVSPNGALWVDAATFACSALLVRYGVRARPAPVEDKRVWSWSGFTLVRASPRLKALVALGCVSGFYIAGEAVVAPYAADIGGGAVAVGLLLAAYAVGNVIGVAALTRLIPARRQNLLVPLAVLACAPLTICVLHPGLVITMMLWALSGAASAYNLTASTLFVQSVPDAQRGQAFGLAITALRVSQGVGVLGAGIVAEYIAPHFVVALAGLLGMLAAASAGWSWLRARQNQPV